MLCIKLEIDQGYTTRHGQPIIKTSNFIPLLRPFVSFLWTPNYIFIFTPQIYILCFIYFHCFKFKNIRFERKVSRSRLNKVLRVLEQWELWSIFSIKRNLSCVSDETRLLRSSSKQGCTNFPEESERHLQVLGIKRRDGVTCILRILKQQKPPQNFRS
jgi:hypothetical protein